MTEEITAYKELFERYKKGFELFEEYWDSLPDEIKEELDKELRELGL